MKTPRILYRFNVTVTKRLLDNYTMVLPSGRADKWSFFTDQYDHAACLWKLVGYLDRTKQYDRLQRINGKIHYTIEDGKVWR